MVLNIGGNLRNWDRAAVMGVVNVTPDSFWSGSRVEGEAVVKRAEEMLAAGADIIDLGGCSTRRGSEAPSVEEELSRLLPSIESMRRKLGSEFILSVDTYRASVARECVAAGADIVNDIGGGTLDEGMFEAVAELKVPYVLMHTRGTPADMQGLAHYSDVTSEVLRDLAFKTDRLRQLGVADVIIDPGFGFAKSIDQSYRLLGELAAFKTLGCPILAGLSRKSMIYKELLLTPDDALNGTTALNMIALLNGADILRVHDVAEAVQTVSLYEAYRRNLPDESRTITLSDTGGETISRTIL